MRPAALPCMLQHESHKALACAHLHACMHPIIRQTMGAQADRAKRKQDAEGGPAAELAAPPEFEAATAQAAAGAAWVQGHGCLDIHTFPVQGCEMYVKPCSSAAMQL